VTGDELLALRPDDPSLLENLAQTYQRQGDLDRARSYSARARAAAATR